MRILLEGLIGGKVALQADAQGLVALEKIISEMRNAVAAGDITRYAGLNIAFHDTLARLTGNRKLHATYARLVGGLVAVPAPDLRAQRELAGRIATRTPRGIRGHRARRADEAAALLQRHASDSRQRLHRALASEQALYFVQLCASIRKTRMTGTGEDICEYGFH